MQTKFQNLRAAAQRQAAKLGLVGAAAAAYIENAMAALPAEATAAMAQLSANTTDMLAAVWPIVALSVGGFALIKLFKKGASKAV